VARLANSPGYELVKAERKKGADSNSTNAIDLTMRGWAAHWLPTIKESIASARDYLECAIDPQSAGGH
jgi:hypothetical protein